MAHVPQRPVEDRQRREAQEVELHEPDRLDVVLVELRQDRVRAGLHVQRAEIGELARRDQHAAGVHADVARQAFQLLGEFEQLPHFLLRRLALDEQRLRLARVDDVGVAILLARRRPLQQHQLAGLERNQLRDAVDEQVRHVEHAADVAHRRARGQRAERRDLRHRVRAVLRS